MWPLTVLKRIEAQQRFLVAEAINTRKQLEQIMSAQEDLDSAIADLKAAVSAEGEKLDAEVAALAAAATNAGVPAADVEARVAAIKAITQGINDKLVSLAPPAAPAA